jgi:hypothetical protein
MSLKNRATQGNVDAALAILNRTPDVDPDPDDALIETKETPRRRR